MWPAFCLIMDYAIKSDLSHNSWLTLFFLLLYIDYLIFELKYFFILTLFGLRGRFLLSNPRFYCKHSDSACPRCFPLWKMPDSKFFFIYFTNIDLLQVLAAPAHGSVAVEYEETLLQFHCAPTHRLVGPPTLACLDGISWNGTVPHCQRRPEPTVSSGRRPTGGGQRLGGPPNGLLLVMAVVLQSMIKSR